MRHVPFGVDWEMPVDVSVSEWVVASGLAWSCGQCPLDAAGSVVAPGDVEAQARLVSERIGAALGRAGLTLDGVLAMVLYGTDPVRSAAVLRRALPEDVAIAPVATPPLYYPGMTLEIDVLACEAPVTRIGAEGATVGVAPGLTAVTWSCEARGARPVPSPAELAALAGRKADAAVSGLLAVPTAKLAANWSPASVRLTPAGAPITALLLLADGPAVVERTSAAGVVTETAEAGPLLRITAWSPDPAVGLGEQSALAMDALIRALSARGLGPEALVKVSAHHVGEGAAALHESLAARHRRHARPGPASTGLGVAGLGPGGAAVVIEAIAAR